MRRTVGDLRSRGAAALGSALPVLDAAGRLMASRLRRHARKEDEALFPAMERALDAAGPTAVMREEHRAIHQRSRLFRETLRALEEVEHPAIVAGGARLRALAAGPPDAAALAAAGAEILDLLDLHFAKEEEILFPMAHALLSRDDLDAVMERMTAIEAEPDAPA